MKYHDVTNDNYIYNFAGPKLKAEIDQRRINQQNSIINN